MRGKARTAVKIKRALNQQKGHEKNEEKLKAKEGKARRRRGSQGCQGSDESQTLARAPAAEKTHERVRRESGGHQRSTAHCATQQAQKET
jgi:hypothetical protein